MRPVEKMSAIGNLEQFSAVLQGETIDFFPPSKNVPIYFVQENGEVLFLYDDTIPEYYKVPELAGTRFLMDMKLLEAMTQRYVPIYDIHTGEELFSKEEFLELRQKMSGLSIYGSEEFIFSKNLEFPGMEYYLERIDSNLAAIQAQEEKINRTFSHILSALGFSISSLTGPQNVEIIDTGSTSRGTNIPNNHWDFDFMFRIPPEQLSTIRDGLVQGLPTLNGKNVITRNRIRLQQVTIEGIDVPLDIDISFVPNQMTYFSTEQALQMRLEQIKKQDITKYKLVLANIMCAKQILKQYHAYKPSRSDQSQAGLGGVGIENWILQHGGSLEDAARSFLEASTSKSFLEFERVYSVFDFGKNHVSVAKRGFPYDNFVMKNMRENGYQNMQKALSSWLKQLATEEKSETKTL